MERETFISIKKDVCHWMFEFWAGAREHWQELSYDEREMFFEVIADIYPDGIDETTLNDIMWFDFEWVCEVIGRGEEDEE